MDSALESTFVFGSLYLPASDTLSSPQLCPLSPLPLPAPFDSSQYSGSELESEQPSLLFKSPSPPPPSVLGKHARNEDDDAETRTNTLRRSARILKLKASSGHPARHSVQSVQAYRNLPGTSLVCLKCGEAFLRKDALRRHTKKPCPKLLSNGFSVERG